ncbi:MAG TPA: SNF2-related protein [Chitinophagaceae bacterium]|nr:SNF2-related protein [Chitinophagaceae bacterium]
MALPHLIKYVYNNGTDEVIRRGKKIHAIGFAEMIDHDELTGSVSFRVRDDTYSTSYKVHIQKFSDPKTMTVRCSCPYNLGDICRHETAALLQLQELIDKNHLGDKEVSYKQVHTVAKMKYIDLKTIKLLAGQDNYDEAEKLVRSNRANISLAKDERIEAELNLDGKTFPIIIQKNEERNFDTSCTCNEEDHPLCIHKAFLFFQLLNAYGPYYFDTIRNWDKEKNKLLEAYGYCLQDDLTGKFEFAYKEGKPFLRVLDPGIKKVAPAQVSKVEPVYVPVQKEEIELPQTEVIELSTLRLGIVFNANQDIYPYFHIDVVKGESNEEQKQFIGKTEKLELAKFVNTEVFGETDKMLIQQIRKLQSAEINKYLNRNSPFSGIWENIIHQEGDELPGETKSLINEYLHPKLSKLFEEQKENSFVFLVRNKKTFKTNDLEQLEVSANPISPVFIVKNNKKSKEVSCYVKIGPQLINITDNEWQSPLIFLYNNTLYLWEKIEDVLYVEKFLQKGNIIISENEWVSQLQNFILPLAKEYKVEFDKLLIKEIKEGEPEVRLLLQEKGDYLIFQPLFSYKGFEIKGNEKDTITIAVEDKILIVHRNKEIENTFLQKLEKLHSQFIRPEGGSNLVLRGTDVLKNNWFFLFVDAMKEWKIPVAGFDALKNFRFNTAKPKTQVYISSGMDWFDAKVNIQFGDQQITIADVKKALANKQSFVQLQDGTLGILPEDWLKRYSLLFKVGEGKQENLRLSKYYYSVIDDLYENRNEEELMLKLEEKYLRLKEFKNIKEINIPHVLDHVLRPYQVSGYYWLNYLSEVGWGGILADDMGLGKTVQALTYLQHYKEQNGNLHAVVICPTTLIYNWENEIKKFTPQLTYQIHHGGARTRDNEQLLRSNIVITTYGTLRSDIKLLTSINFDYVVLDESQAIKNPQSKVTKAAGLLKAKNRLCLSGTPLQNNTFDIYAQMNFLNPGMLGSVEFFRNEFATPIDKFGEQEQKDHLKKILYPFILRRTKEQVAKDLPDKTETILFCEMEEEQRNIYDAFRNDYRDKILGVIDSQGIGNSQLTILQGLMKLRQICDSPAIVNEEEKYPNVSIKLEELAREISENIGNHKALIFSQFLGMLALIKEKLKEQNVLFEYFDGSTATLERQRAIDNFQNNEECRVFLISLKAGGVGLNLTAADYVYIVDPWWNPAVEQQAIDRTHRIGQTKNIFAYRMICKDTIEDKILQLQERKRSLAKELIADDATFVKSLTRADVEYLFS